MDSYVKFLLEREEQVEVEAYKLRQKEKKA